MQFREVGGLTIIAAHDKCFAILFSAGVAMVKNIVPAVAAREPIMNTQGLARITMRAAPLRKNITEVLAVRPRPPSMYA